MTEAPPEAPPRYWIFQARRERYDLAERLVVGETAEWELNQYRDRIRPGDIVLLWNTGKADNVMGWGRVVDLGHSRSTKEEGPPTTWVECEARFERPLARDELAAEPFLEALTILRSPTGTNFRLTTLEARRLVQLIGERGDHPPPEPERFAPDAYPLSALQALRIGEEVAGVVGDLALEFDPGGTVPLDQLVPVALQAGRADPLVDEALQRMGSEQLSSLQALTAKKLDAVSDTWDRVGLDDGALEAFELARRVSIATARRESIQVRHLIAALALLRKRSTPDAHAERVDETLMAMGVRPDHFRDVYFAFLEERGEDADPAAWGRLARGQGAGRSRQAVYEKVKASPAEEAAESAAGLEEEKEEDGLDLGSKPASLPMAASEVEPPPGLESATAAEAFSPLLLGPPILSDRPQAEDFLELQDEHRAFARLLADEATDLPLAIGLFGHWGSGKTTFLENLEREIGSRNNPRDPGVGFHVAQIQFNAWHYMESDVWASFADHIFRSLDREVRGRREAEAKLAALISELEVETRLESKLQQKLTDVEDEIETKTRELAVAEKIEADRSGTFEAKLAAFVNSVGSKTTQKVVLNAVLDAEKFFGGDELATIRKQVRTADASFAQLGTEIARVQNFAQSLGKPRLVQLLRNYWWLALALVLLGVGGYFLVRHLHEVVATVIGVATTVVSFVLAKAPLVAQWVERGQKLRDRATELLETLEQDEQAAILEHPVLSRLKKAQDEALRKRVDVEGELDRVRDRKAELEVELAGKPPEERVLDFIKTRAETTDYNERLGTLAIVRRDFQKLSDLLSEQHRSGAVGKLPSIRRIVLYIDDLDRCPWDRVMEVLEAVHLLLAFPLFAVVVAVDARWVRRSVTQHLERMDRGSSRADDDEGAEEARGSDGPENGAAEERSPRVVRRDSGARATPQEYLEKIIQVPFWLKPLEKGERSELLLKMLERQTVNGDAGQGESMDSTPAAASGDDAAAGQVQQPAEVLAGAAAGGGDTDTDDVDGTNDSDHNGSQSPVNPEAGTDDPSSTDSTESLPTSSLDETWAEFRPRSLTAFEIAFFPVLDPLLGRTPRSVKRFLSLYGIARAFRPETESTGFSGENGEHRGVQLLYALQTGWPEIAFPFFRILVDHSDYTDFFELVDFLDSVRKVPDHSSRPAELDEGAPEQWERLFAALAEAKREFAKLPDSSAHPVEVNPMHEWLPFVTRFAFADWSASRHAF